MELFLLFELESLLTLCVRITLIRLALGLGLGSRIDLEVPLPPLRGLFSGFSVLCLGVDARRPLSVVGGRSLSVVLISPSVGSVFW